MGNSKRPWVILNMTIRSPRIRRCVIMQSCLSYHYYIQVLAPGKVCPFIDFVEEDNGIEWDCQGILQQLGPLGFHYLEVLYG